MRRLKRHAALSYLEAKDLGIGFIYMQHRDVQPYTGCQCPPQKGQEKEDGGEREREINEQKHFMPAQFHPVMPAQLKLLLVTFGARFHSAVQVSQFQS